MFPQTTPRPLLSVTLLSAFALLAANASSTAAAQQYKQIKRLGTRQAICKPAISNGAELQAFFANQRNDVLAMLSAAEWEGDPEDLFRAVEVGEFEQKAFGVGSRLEWMGRRVDNRITAQPRVEWAGQEAFNGFEINVASNCKIYQMVVPNACCNLSLASASDVSTPEPAVEITEGADGIVTVAATAPGGSSVEVILTRPDGTQSLLPLDGNGVWSGRLEPADYTFTAIARDPCGSSTPVIVPLAIALPVAESIAPTARKISPYVAPFIGRQVRDYDPFLIGVEGGIQFPLLDRFALFGQIGGSYNTEDSELSAYADIGGDLLFTKGFIGLGIGVWDINNSDTRDNTLFIHGGGDTPWTAGSSKIQWFAEGRIFEDATYVPDNNILKLGLRFSWR